MDDLTPTALALKERVLGGWELTDVELATFEQALRQLSMAERLAECVDKDGIMIPGSTGQMRLNPCVAEGRAASQAAARLLGKLGLKDAIPTATSQRARHAANARWL